MYLHVSRCEWLLSHPTTRYKGYNCAHVSDMKGKEGKGTRKKESKTKTILNLILRPTKPLEMSKTWGHQLLWAAASWTWSALSDGLREACPILESAFLWQAEVLAPWLAELQPRILQGCQPVEQNTLLRKWDFTRRMTSICIRSHMLIAESNLKSLCIRFQIKLLKSRRHHPAED